MADSKQKMTTRAPARKSQEIDDLKQKMKTSLEIIDNNTAEIKKNTKIKITARKAGNQAEEDRLKNNQLRLLKIIKNEQIRRSLIAVKIFSLEYPEMHAKNLIKRLAMGIGYKHKLESQKYQHKKLKNQVDDCQKKLTNQADDCQKKLTDLEFELEHAITSSGDSDTGDIDAELAELEAEYEAMTPEQQGMGFLNRPWDEQQFTGERQNEQFTGGNLKSKRRKGNKTKKKKRKSATKTSKRNKTKKLKYKKSIKNKVSKFSKNKRKNK